MVLSDAIFEKEAMRQRNFDEIQRLARLASFQGLGAGKHQGQGILLPFPHQITYNVFTTT